jgi:hypothetical protein
MNCFETIEKDGLIIRNLNISDLGAYMDLFNKLGTNMFGVDLTNYGGAIETLASSKLMSSNNITRGVFENGKLILTVGSFYKDTFNSWYEHSHYSAIKQDFNKWCTAHYYAIVPLFDYYESLGYFSYYTRRSLADQRKWRKIDKMKIFANVPDTLMMLKQYTLRSRSVPCQIICSIFHGENLFQKIP